MTAAVIAGSVILTLAGFLVAMLAIPTFGPASGSHARPPARLWPRRYARKALRAARRRLRHTPRSTPGPLQAARVNALVAAAVAHAVAWSVPDPAGVPWLQRQYKDDTGTFSAIAKGEQNASATG